MGVGQAECIDQAVAPAGGRIDVLIAVKLIEGRHPVIDRAAHRLAKLHPSMVFPGAPLLLREARGGHTQGANAALGGIEFRARGSDGDPHRRMGALQWLRQHGPLRHGEANAVVGVALLHPHLGDGAHEFIPSLLGVVRVHLEARQLGPGGGAGGAELQPTAGQQIQGRGPLRHPDGVVHLRHADHRAVADADIAGLHGAGREEQLRC